LRVLIVGPYYPDIGGVTSYVHNLALELIIHGHSVAIFQTRPGKDYLWAKLKVYRLPYTLQRRIRAFAKGLLVLVRFSISDLRGFIKVSKSLLLKPREVLRFLIIMGRVYEIINDFSPHIIHSNHLSTRSLACGVVSRILGIPMVITAHGYDTSPPSSLGEYLLRNIVLNYTDRAIVLTKTKRRILELLYVFYSSKVIVIPNCIPCKNTLVIRTVRNNEELLVLKKETKMRLGIDPRNIVIAFLGRINRRKGVFDILECAKNICQSKKELCSKMKILIVGSGKDKELVEKSIEELKVPNVMFIGSVDKVTKNIILRATDLLLLPTYHDEAFPTVILEAYAEGTPVIAYPFLGANEIIEKGVTGFVLHGRNVRLLCEMLYDICNKMSMLNKMGFNALVHIKKKYCCEHLVHKRIVPMYRDLLAQRCKAVSEWKHNDD